MKKTILTMMAAIAFACGFAQDAQDVLKMLVEKDLISQAELDSLVKQKQEERKKPATILSQAKSAFMSDAFRLSGYGQIIYTATENPGNIAQAPTTTHNSFEVARVILFATGRLGAKDQFGYMVMYDFGPNHKLHEVYGEWLPEDWLKVRAGQFKIPFTIENPMSPTRIETIYFTRSASAMSGSAGDFNQFNPDGSVGAVKAGRDAGIQLYGTIAPFRNGHSFEYYAGLFNGTGFNTKDNNNHKDFVGSLYYSPLKGLRMGGSVYSGKLYHGLYGDPAANHVRNRWAAGAEYSGSRFYARSEYLEANDGGLKRSGAYASAVWKIVPDKWEVLCKCDYYNDNKSAKSNEITDYTGGINYYFSYLSRLQLNYIYTDNKQLGSNNMIAAQLQVFF